jgi:hypothetical protein
VHDHSAIAIKYRCRNPIVRVLMRGFFRALRDFVDAADRPRMLLDIGAGGSPDGIPGRTLSAVVDHFGRHQR